MGKVVSVRFNDCDLKILNDQCDNSGLTVSEFLRRSSSKKRVPSKLDHDAVLNLLNLNADQARLGNLLKLTIDVLDELSGNELDQTINQITDLEARIRETQKSIQEIVMQINL